MPAFVMSMLSVGFFAQEFPSSMRVRLASEVMSSFSNSSFSVLEGVFSGRCWVGNVTDCAEDVHAGCL